MDFKKPEAKPRVLKSTKILMVRSLSYLENGPLKNMGITDWVYMPYFKPTIDFSKLQYISSSESWFSNSNYRSLINLGFLMDLDNLIILEGCKHTMHAVF